MKRVFIILTVALFLCACSSQKYSIDAEQNDSIEPATEAVTTMIQVEMGTTEEKQVKEEQKEKVAEGSYAAVNKFFEEFVSNNTSIDRYELSSQVEGLAKKYGLFSDSKNTGMGVMYYKVATSRDEARLISNDDLKKGTYYVYIIGDFQAGRPSANLVDNRYGTEIVITSDSVEETKQGSTSEKAQANWR